MRNDQNQKTNKIETAGIWAASFILLAFLIAGHVIAN
jgi:hypothetical protein